MSYHTIGRYLNRESASSHAEAYEKYVVKVFIFEWARLGGFPLSEASAKYCRQFAIKFTRAQLKKALKKGATWSELRQLSRAGDSGKHVAKHGN